MPDAPSSPTPAATVPAAPSSNFVVREVSGLLHDVWGALRALLRSQTTWVAVATWTVGAFCDRYGCDKAQTATYALGAMKMLQRALADFGKSGKSG